VLSKALSWGITPFHDENNRRRPKRGIVDNTPEPLMVRRIKFAWSLRGLAETALRGKSMWPCVCRRQQIGPCRFTAAASQSRLCCTLREGAAQGVAEGRVSLRLLTRKGNW
jgi:hypothetical protein